jgi:hypothetical protein
VFDACPMPSPAIRDRLADRLGMSRKYVQTWFQNRRSKCKRERRGSPFFQATAKEDRSLKGPKEHSKFDEMQLEELLGPYVPLTPISPSTPSSNSIYSQLSSPTSIIPGTFGDSQSNLPSQYEWMDINLIEKLICDSFIVSPNVLGPNLFEIERRGQQFDYFLRDPFLDSEPLANNELFDFYLTL